MAFTFLAAAGHDIGDSMVDKERIPECAELLRSDTPILLPTDIVALESGATFGCDCTDGAFKTIGSDIPDGWRGLDIGPATADAYGHLIKSAGTVLWNGPMGAFEDVRFSAGTEEVARAMAACAGYTVVGGGDSAAAVDALDLEDRISFISTGGGASLELLEYGDLPGLAALRGAVNAPPIEDDGPQGPTDR
jgi:phosphoglycerate kinase